MWCALLAACVLSSGSGTLDDPIVVEAERPLARTPGDGSFARPHPLRWASGREAVLRFGGPGRCTYALDVPHGGRWFLWLRYAAASSLAVRAGFLGEDEGEELPVHELAASGALEGKHAWTWGRLFAGELAAGTHRFALAGAPFRPDCLLLTTRDGVPDYLAPSPPPTYDAATRALLARPLVVLRPGWRGETEERALPEWFDDTRVCMHTRLSARWLLRDRFTTAAARFRSLGVTCFVRHLKTLGEGAWWPSAVGPREIWATDVDVAGGVIDRAHEAGCRLIAYYRHMEDEGMAERHPAWRCIDDRGEPYLRRGGNPMMCFNSPYTDFLEKRLLELVERGADGFYFDESHMPSTGCWCEFCRRAFHEATGLEHPTAIDDEDPLYRKLQDFTNLTIERTFRRLRRSLLARSGDVVLVVGSYRMPDFLDRHLSERLLRDADSVKTEFDKGASGRGEHLVRAHPGWREAPRDVRLSFGWDYCRDAADGRPPHVWIPRLTEADEAVLATAAVITHGGIANLDHPEASLPDPGTFGEAVRAGNLLSATAGGRRPWRWAAVHVSEATRDRLAPDRDAWWRQGYAVAAGAYETLLRERLPVGLVTDSRLADGDLEGYEVLFLPAPDDLGSALRRTVDRFRAEGGLVVEQEEGWAWHETEGFASARRALLAAVAERRAVLPFEVRGGPATMHVVGFPARDFGGLVLLLVNDFGAVLRGRAGKPAPPPPPCTGVRLEFAPTTLPLRVRELGFAGSRARPVPADGVVELSPFAVFSIVFLEP